MTDLVAIRNISHSFGNTPVLRQVSLGIAPKSYTVLLGPSGSGKTTLLSILGGFLQPMEGQVLINGKDVTGVAPARRPTATVFQDYALFPHMSIGNNVGFGLRMRGVAKQDRNDKSRAMLDIVGLAHAFHKKPHELSGGQRQRVALARALVIEPDVLLLDEPLGALDLKLRRLMQDELKAIQRRVGMAFVHVTHDQEEAMALADQLVVMNDGRIEDAGPPERVYARPATRFAASFMGESTVFEGSVGKSGSIATAIGKVPSKLQPGTRVHVAARPEHVVVGRGAVATVEDVVFQGSYKRVMARLASGEMVLARCPADMQVAQGASIRLALDPAHAIVLTS
jgi:spermidine/putrescine transport system ATP-binding protein